MSYEKSNNLWSLYWYIYICTSSEYELVSVFDLNRCAYNSGWVLRKVIVCCHFIYTYIHIYIYSEYELVSVVDMNRCVYTSGWDIRKGIIQGGGVRFQTQRSKALIKTLIWDNTEKTCKNWHTQPYFAA